VQLPQVVLSAFSSEQVNCLEFRIKVCFNPQKVKAGSRYLTLSKKTSQLKAFQSFLASKNRFSNVMNQMKIGLVTLLFFLITKKTQKRFKRNDVVEWAIREV